MLSEVKENIYSESVEFQASLSLETQRLPDPWHYLIRDGKLYSPITSGLVADSITRNDSVEEAEYESFQTIQDWAVKSQTGRVVWISPRHPAKYDYTSAKIIFSEIVDNAYFGKALLNRAICFDWDSEMCLDFARKIGASDIADSEGLRRHPVFLSAEVAESLLEIIAKYTPDQVELIRTGKDFLIKEKLKSDLALGQLTPIGQFMPSCGGSAFGVMYRNSLLHEAFFNCPKCHSLIPSGQGITTCPHCGARKEDYASACD